MESKILNRILETQFIILWAFAVIIPKSYFKIIFVSEIGIFALYTFLNGIKLYQYMKTSSQTKLIFRLFFCFFAVAAFMLWFSYHDITGYWHLEYVLFDKRYVYRHFMVVAELFLSIGLSIAIFRSDTLFKLSAKHLLLSSVIIGLIMIYNQYYVIFLGGLFVATISLFSVKAKTRLPILLVPLVMISHSAYVIAASVMILLIFCREPMRKFFSHNATKKIIILIVVFILAVYFGQDELYRIIRRDQNSLWRLIVWQNEIETLASTWYTGVGFGTSYVTVDIYNFINNANMYMDSDGTIYDRIFLVANHNSLLNMFYRMGILGGGLFLLLNIMLCSACLNFSKKYTEQSYEYHWWAFTNYIYNLVIITLNPGMEMMQFAINYTFSLAIILSVILRGNHETTVTKRNDKRTIFGFRYW